MVQPLVHKDTTLSVEELAAEAEAYLKRKPAFNFMSQFIISARNLGIWDVDQELSFLSIADRMRALEARSDIRADVMHKVTGIFPALASKMPLLQQTELLEAALESQTLTAEALLIIFNDVAPIVYFDTDIFYTLWQNRSQDLMQNKEDVVRKFFIDILSIACNCGWHWEVRMALRHAWHMYIPIEMREKVDLIRLENERRNPRTRFTSKQELEIITPEIILQDLPLADFQPVLEMIKTKLGIDQPEGITDDLLQEFADDEPPSSKSDAIPEPTPDTASESNFPKA